MYEQMELWSFWKVILGNSNGMKNEEYIICVENEIGGGGNRGQTKLITIMNRS